MAVRPGATVSGVGPGSGAGPGPGPGVGVGVGVGVGPGPGPGPGGATSVNAAVAGDWSELPTVSTARTANVWSPAPGESVWGLAHRANSPLSRLHSNI